MQRPHELAPRVGAFDAARGPARSGRVPTAGEFHDAVHDPRGTDGIDEAVNHIRNQRLSHGAPPVTGSEPSAPVAALAALMLTASRSARPMTARAFAEVLRGLAGGRRSAVQR